MSMTKAILCIGSIILISIANRVAADPITKSGASEPTIDNGATAAVIENGEADTTTVSSWANGISADEQTLALQLFREGNEEFNESRFTLALAKYRTAIKHWEHPAISFNMAICLIKLDRLIDAKHSLERGLRYGAAPLSEELYQQGLSYRGLLTRQLTELTIISAEEGVQVMLDGEYLFTGPGGAVRTLQPGDHLIVATKPGFLVTSKTLRLAPGATMTFSPALVPIEHTVRLRTTWRWERWKPFVALGASGVLIGLGMWRYHALLNDREAFGGEMLAFLLGATGGVTLVTSVISLYLNKPGFQQTTVVTTSGGGAILNLRWGF